MKKVLFIDRDGTLIEEPRDNFQVDSFYKLSFYPGAITWLSRIAKEMDYELVMVTNQDGLGTPSFPEEWFWPVQNFVVNTFAGEGVFFTDIHIDRTFPQQNAPTRKPGTGMLHRYFQGGYDLKQSFVIGDRITDVQLAANIGCKAIWMDTGSALGYEEVSGVVQGLNESVAIKTLDWKEIYTFLKQKSRDAQVSRKTNETNVSVMLNLDGTGISEIQTGLGFFDHMLEQIARHGGIDLEINCDGDLEVDEHHSIEDVALALGEAFRNAMGKKTGMERYGFSLPMDEAAASVLIDFGGRPHLKWKVKLKREFIGDVPVEMFKHFFESFAQTAGANIHISAKGENEHHIIEAVFKSFARAVKQAITINIENASIPTTKGVI
jgi:imidazoleglycerol-phosphate dehydratase/histidinol-phosphatase